MTNLHLKRKGDEPVEKLIRRFFRKLGKLGVIQHYLETQEYEKPSAKKRRLRKKREQQFANNR